MRFWLIMICLVSAAVWAGEAGDTDTQTSLREALDLQAPAFVLTETQPEVQLAKKAACTLASSKNKGLLKTCTYDCPCGKRSLRRKGKQECPKTWKFEC